MAAEVLLALASSQFLIKTELLLLTELYLNSKYVQIDDDYKEQLNMLTELSWD